MDELSIFGQAIEIADDRARAEFVERACNRNAQLMAPVNRLLEVHDHAGSFLEHSPLDPATQETVLTRNGVSRDRHMAASDQVWLNLLGPSDDPESMGRMGEYDILSIAGRGGMGVVYRAQQRAQRWTVAIKMIGNPAFCTPDAIRRLKIEADAAARLQHKNIVAIHEFGEFQGLHYYSMEYVEGRTLNEVSAGRPLFPEQAARYAESIANAIHYAHREGVLHRDLKPANIMIDEGDCVRITDFGLAKLMDSSGTITETGQILGTASYMSPEQASARHADIGPCSDIYSIGAILYELLTGQPPFQGDSILEILRRVCEQEPVPPRQINPNTPQDLETICLRCLQKNVKQRYASADELARDLHRFRVGQPVLTPSIRLEESTSVLQQARVWMARHRTSIAVSAVIAVLGCLAIWWIPTRNKETTTSTAEIADVQSGLLPRVAENPQPPPKIEVATQAAQREVASRGVQQLERMPAEKVADKKPDKVAVELPQIPLPKGIDDPPRWIEALKLAESPEATVTAKAIAGEPLGVAEIVIRFNPKSRPTLKPDDPVWITEQAQRVLYPAVIVDRDNEHRASRVTARFLFRGKEDLHLTATAVGSYPITVTPERNDLNSNLLEEWWKDYSRPTSSVVEQLAGHDMLRNYLTLMLSRRMELNLPWTPPASPTLFGANTGGDEFLHLLLGTSSIRVALQKDVLLNVANREERADSQLPRAVALPPVTIPPFAAAPVEPIATHVPEECFYVRCATFADWQWFRSTLSAWGGNLSELVTQRGLDQGIQRRLEKQLALSEETSKDLFANDALAEFALIGSDTFYIEGAAIGVVLRARDNAAVQNVIERQRRSVARVNPQAQQTMEEIAGHDVSFLSTPDNSVRSFHAVDGDVHFVTTSRRLVERFFEAGQGQRSLANLRAFQYARSKFLLTRADPVFIYLSDPFFINFLSPHYRIEMTRRAQALADLELVQMARWAAIAERRPYRTVADLVTSGLLPGAVQFRPDKSQVLLEEGKPTDSLRGAAGTFLPIPDLTITKATASECAAYEQFADAYREVWARMDPVTIALNRRPSSKPGHEDIVCDVSITPIHALFGRPLEMAFVMGVVLPTRTAVKPPAGSLLHASAELNLRSWLPQIKPVLVFLGLGDLRDESLVSFRNGSLELAPLPDQERAILDLNVYGGLNDFKAVAQSARFDLNDVISAMSDAPSQLSLGQFIPALWARSWKTWLVAAAHRDTLQQVASSLEVVTSERIAQLRLTLADLQGTRWGALARSAFFCQARHLSAANPRFLHELMQQLHLECDEARPLAEELLRGKLVCPLGGDYVTVSAKDRPARWVGTAWSHASLIDENAVPQKYEAPFLHWFHGLSVETTVSVDTLTVHFELNTKPDGAKILETQAQLETEARAGLERILEKQKAEQRRAAFHDWVNRFQDHAIVEKSRTMLPDLWQQREEEAQQHLAALDEPEDETDLLRIASDYPLTAAADKIAMILRERKVIADWQQLARTLTGLSLQERRFALEKFVATYPGTKEADHASHEVSNLKTQEQNLKLREDAASRRLKDIRTRHRSGYPQGLDLFLTEYSGTSAAQEALRWKSDLIGIAVRNLKSNRIPDRGDALQFLVEADWSDDSQVTLLIKLMLEEPRAESRLDAARLVNRLREPAWDRAARALRAEAGKSSKCKEAQRILGVNRGTQIKPEATFGK